MILVVADTSPIHYLIQIGTIDVLPRFFDEIVIPRAVIAELLDPSTPQIVHNWASALPKWAVVRGATHIQPLNLDKGETEATHVGQGASSIRSFTR